MEGESWKGAFAACVAVVVVARLLGSSASAQQQPPVRTGVVAVPVDVRVVDSLGNPVTDLGLADFEIFEDGQRQTISHFGRWDLSSTSSVKRASDSSAAGEPYSRAFLIVLGRGRLEGPNKGLTAVESFVRSLHPTDRVAMLAYKRATDLTTDREPPLRFLRWFRERHHSLDVLLPKFPHDRARVEAQLAEAFKDPSLPGVREIPSPFAADNLSSLHFGIEYLRAVQGEKHLVFLSQEHLGVGSKRMMDGFAQRAADARVTVTVLNSGGTPLTIRQPSAASRGSAVTQSARSFRQAFGRKRRRPSRRVHRWRGVAVRVSRSSADKTLARYQRRLLTDVLPDQR